MAGGIEILQDHDFVAALFIDWQDRERILARLCHPKPPLCVERHVHWLADLGLARNQLRFESRRQMKSLPFLLGRQRLSFAYDILERVGRKRRANTKQKRPQSNSRSKANDHG